MPRTRQPNDALRDAIAGTGWSYDSVARAVRRIAAENGEILATNKSAVAHWVNGTTPSERTASYLVEALSRRAGRPVTFTQIGLVGLEALTLGADPVKGAATLGRSDVEHLGFLAIAAYTAADVAMPLDYDHEPVARMLHARTGTLLVGDAEIAVVHQITSVFASADEVLGGGHGLSTVAAYLADTVVPMLDGRYVDKATRARAYGGAAELAWLLGWKHHDLGQEGAAQRYYRVGFQLACEADPHTHTAWMMRAIAQQALSMKQPKFCADLIAGALDRGRGHLDGTTESLLHITSARAHAATGDSRTAVKALIHAEDALHRDRDEPPSFTLLAGPAAGTVDSHTARTLTELGDHVGTEARHRAALLSWDPVKYKRVHMLTYADLGDCLAAQTRADEAIAAWGYALDLAEGLSSGRGSAAISSVRPTLAVYRRRGVPGAAGLERRIREAAV